MFSYRFLKSYETVKQIKYRQCKRFYSKKNKELTEEDILNKKCFESWDKQAMEKLTGYSSLLKSSNHVEVPKYMYQRRRREEKVLDLKINLQDSPFELNEKDDHYYLNGTKIPQHLEHWIESPGGIKRSRDHMLIRKMEKMRNIAAEKFKLKQRGGNKSDIQLAERYKVTRRMERYNHMIHDILERNLDDLPALLMSRKIGQRHVNNSVAESIASSMLHFDKVEVSKDLRHVKVYWSCLDGHQGIIERHIKRIEQVLRHQLAGSAYMKYAPEIHLVKEELTIQQKSIREAGYRIQDEILEYENRVDKDTIPPYKLHSDTIPKMDVYIKGNDDSNESVFYKKRY